MTLSNGKSIAPGDPLVDGPIKLIAERTVAAGKIAGAFAWGGGRAQAFREMGYRLIALATDHAYMMTGIKTMLTDLGAGSAAHLRPQRLGASGANGRQRSSSVAIGEFRFDCRDDARVLGHHVGGEAGGDVAVPADQEFLEIPVDRGVVGIERAARFRRETPRAAPLRSGGDRADAGRRL